MRYRIISKETTRGAWAGDTLVECRTRQSAIALCHAIPHCYVIDRLTGATVCENR
jgi:hypothetical protein